MRCSNGYVCSVLSYCEFLKVLDVVLGGFQLEHPLQGLPGVTARDETCW
jgi:hypothetical protein